MTIENATLQRIDTPVPAASGDFSFTDGAAISVRCCLADPSARQQWKIDDLELDATAMLFVDLDRVAAFPINARVTVQPDAVGTTTFPADVYLVRRAFGRVGPIPHWELYLKAQ